MHFDINAVLQNMPALLRGVQLTVILVLVSLGAGALLGVVACFGKLMRRGLLYWIATAYEAVMRGIPEMVVMFWIYYCGPLILNARLSSFSAAAASMSLYAGAFLAEIFRAGILAVPRGQGEAAQALGVPGFWAWADVILPQAARLMIPAFIGLVTLVVKVSGLASAIGVGELVYEATVVSGQNYRYLELFTAVGVFYFALIFPLSLFAQHYERKLARKNTMNPDDAGDIIVCESLGKRYGGFTALKAVDFRVRRGEVVCIVGPSGGGKSTLLRTLNALETIDQGTITVDGIRLPGSRHDVQRIRREVGMVFQSFNLFPHMTVRRNVTLAPMRARGTSREEANERAERLLARVGIADQIDKYPEQLSGGQQQRVAIARALAMEPRVMLFDEPTSALDAEMVSEVLQVIREMVGTGMTMVIVTHELGFAREAADRIVFMAGGAIAVEAPPEAFFANKTDERLVSFLSKVL